MCHIRGVDVVPPGRHDTREWFVPVPLRSKRLPAAVTPAGSFVLQGLFF